MDIMKIAIRNAIFIKKKKTYKVNINSIIPITTSILSLTFLLCLLHTFYYIDYSLL